MQPVRPPRRWKNWQDGHLMRWVRAYMGYSRSEARGMVLLLLAIALVLLAPMALRPALPTYDPTPDQQDLDRLVAQLKEHRLESGSRAYASRYPKRKYPSRKYPAVPQVALAPFDPNQLSATDWEARGVPHFVAARIVKYREAAGGFRSKSQIEKMYGLEPAVYQRLAPYMQLPDAPPGRGERPAYAAGAPGRFGGTGPHPPFDPAMPGKYPRKPRNLQPFDLNLADTTQLMQIRGIGHGRAWGVVKERNRLGGYVREDQLQDVWVLHDAPDLVDSLRKYTFVASGYAPERLNINTASFDDLYPHPYIRKPLARMLVAYRTQHGPYKSADDLKNLVLMKPEDLEKLRPYVRCE